MHSASQLLIRTPLNSSHLLPADTVPLATEMGSTDDKTSILLCFEPAASPWPGKYFPAAADG